MKKRNLFSLCLLSLGLIVQLSVSGQYYKNENKVWQFGRKALVDFNTVPPTAQSTNIAQAATEGCATVSDSTGQLLFHTQGTTVWNRNGVIMPNGNFITGIPAPALPTISTTQGSLIMPVPDSPGRYFIFSIPELYSTGHFGKLFCNKVNMALDNGYGDIDTSFSLRHVVLDTLLTERMFAASGCGNNWLIVHSRDTVAFKAYKVTSEGLAQNPVISYTGNFPKSYYIQGASKVSPGGRTIVSAIFSGTQFGGNGLEIYDFDPVTGIVSNARTLDLVNKNYGVAFSPDNKKLYVHESANPGRLFQYDLDYSATDSIIASKTLMGVCSPITDLKLAPDGKIYFFRHFITGRVLGSLESPNLVGAAADFRDTSLILPQGSTVYHGLPNEIIVAPLQADTTFSRLDTAICKVGDSLVIAIPADASEVLWSDNDTSKTRTLTMAGTYRVSYKYPCPMVDTIIINASMPEWMITIDENVLGTTYGFDSYQWYKGQELLAGETDSVLTVEGNAVYSVVITLGDCTDSLFYVVTNQTGIEDHQYRVANTTVYPNPAKDMVYIKSPGDIVATVSGIDGKKMFTVKSKAIDLRSLTKGIYFLSIKSKSNQLIKVEKIVKL